MRALSYGPELRLDRIAARGRCAGRRGGRRAGLSKSLRAECYQREQQPRSAAGDDVECVAEAHGVLTSSFSNEQETRADWPPSARTRAAPGTPS